jgi:type I restriction enzyme S subunit
LCPPLIEQERIVSVLGLWDTAIEKQSELIEKLKLRKRALMQQLLTGKKRLPGFSGEWKEVKLGDVSTFLRNNTLSREQLNDDDGVINNIHYGDVLIKYPSIIDCRKEKLQYINHGVSILTDYVENGDIIMSDTAEDETVGRVCEVQNVGNKKILAGLHTMLIRPHDKLFAPYYLGYYLNSEAYHKQLIPLIQGIKVCSIGKVAVQNTVLRIPSLEEQRIIASVLVKADKEIELAKEKLANLQSQKRGLMQQLLTGKKRINS